MADEIGNPSARCHALFAIGVTAANEDPVGAAGVLAECVELSDQVGNQWTAGMSRVVLLRAQAGLADRRQVLASAGELLQHWLGVGDWAQVWTTLQVVAALLAEHGRDVDALTVEAALVRAGLGAGFYTDELSQQHAAAVDAARLRVSAEEARSAQVNGEQAVGAGDRRTGADDHRRGTVCRSLSCRLFADRGLVSARHDVAGRWLGHPGLTGGEQMPANRRRSGRRPPIRRDRRHATR